MSTFSPPTASRPMSTRRMVLVVSLGNVLEWFDWLVFAQLASVISVHFFPADDKGAALLNTLAVFGIGFFFRPLGGMVLTALSDRAGRKVGLVVTISLIAGGALLIGISPTYAQVGLLAPLLLVVARAMQGMSAGGEAPAVASYLAEVASPGRRGMYGSLNFVTATTGSILATAFVLLLQNVLTVEQLSTWGWRIPFLLGAAAGVVTLFLRRHMAETEAFHEARSNQVAPASPIRELFLHHKAKVAALFLLSGLTGVWYYTFASYLPAYLAGQGLDREAALGASMIALTILVIALPLMGLLSDRIGRRAPLLCFCAAVAVTAVPIFHLLEPTFGSQLLLQSLALLIFSLFGSVGFAAMAEQFPTQVRTVGVGLPYGLGVAVFGGSAPYLLEWLASHGSSHLFPWYMAALAVVAFLATTSVRNRTDEPLT